MSKPTFELANIIKDYKISFEQKHNLSDDSRLKVKLSPTPSRNDLKPIFLAVNCLLIKKLLQLIKSFLRKITSEISNVAGQFHITDYA